MNIYKEFKGVLKRFRLFVAVVKYIRSCIHVCRKIIWYSTRHRAIGSYLRSHQVRKLQIGAKGNIMQGWLNTDIYPVSRGVVFLDATKPFPFEDNTFDYIFCEHLIEHLTYFEGVAMLHECFRVLKPGGKIRIATPCFEALIGLYTMEKTDLQRRYIQWTMEKFFPEAGVKNDVFVINNIFSGWGHRFIYDCATLQRVLEEAKFDNITTHISGESNDENLRGIESHGKIIGDEEMNRFETMVLEAKRPN